MEREIDKEWQDCESEQTIFHVLAKEKIWSVYVSRSVVWIGVFMVLQA